MADATGVAEAMLGLDGFRVLAVSETDVEVLIEVETTAVMVGCPRCGVVATAQDRMSVEYRDLAVFGRPARLVWDKRRWRCEDSLCAARTCTESSPEFSARCLLTDRAGRECCRQNDSALGVCNGTRTTVRDVEPVLGIVTLQLDGGPIRQVPVRYAAEHLEHGYALTGHAAQGASVERAFVLLRAEGALAEWGYVAASRARAETRLYAIGPELVDDAGLMRHDPEPAARRLADALSRTTVEPPVLARVARE